MSTTAANKVRIASIGVSGIICVAMKSPTSCSTVAGPVRNKVIAKMHATVFPIHFPSRVSKMPTKVIPG